MNTSGDKEKWREIVDSWRKSGLSKSEFFRKQKIVPSSFHYWFRKLEGIPRKSQSKKKPKMVKPTSKTKAPDSKKLAADEKPAFVEISIPKSDGTSNTTGQVFRITTSYGAVMEIPI